ncbi:MAG: class I SAM-dependent methyltransferase, partial [Inhella sp.]
AALPPVDAHRYPLSHCLLRHVLHRTGPERQQALLDFYAPLPATHFDALEADIGHTLQASGRSLQTCLQDLDRFNALTPETENDAWYERPEAFTSMQLDAALAGFSRRRLLQLRDQILSRTGPLRQVLEVGCGSGYLSAQLVDTLQDCHLTLLDRSAAAVAFVEAYHLVRGTGGRVSCGRADLAALPADDGRFDLVIAAEVLEHAPDADAAAVELLRVLRPGGWLAVSLPIDLDIAMHPTVFASRDEILAFFARHGLQAGALSTVRPDPRLDAIAKVFPDFVGCVNALFQKPADQPSTPAS